MSRAVSALMAVAFAVFIAVCTRALLDWLAGDVRLWHGPALGVTSACSVILLLVLRRNFGQVDASVDPDAPTEDLALIDPMTGIPNATRFEDKLTGAVWAGQDMAVLLVDLAGFGEVNTRRGRAFGDAVLKELAHRVVTLADRHSGFAARLGGDRFGLLLDKGSIPGLSTTCSELATICSVPVSKGGETHVPDVWIAAVDLCQLVGKGHLGFSEFMRIGNFTLMAARASGEAIQIYDHSLEERFVDRDAMIQELPDALQNKALEVFFQPRVNLVDGTVTGFEALVRWSRQGGYVPAADLISIAEDSGLVIDLDRYIVERAIDIVSDWNRRRKTKFSVSVNVSALHFRSGRGVDFIVDSLARYPLPPDLLTVEITETMALDACEGFRTTLARLKETGCKIAIDDFGTGYASLSHLLNLPANEIHIERQLVSEVEENESARLILRAVLSLARNLGLEVLAGGIENEAQAKLLADMGCQRGQGFHFGHPRPASDWLEDVTYSRMPTIPAA